MSCEARTRGSGEVLCAKSTLFLLLLKKTRETRFLCGFQHHERENLFCFLFSNPIVVSLSNEPERKETKKCQRNEPGRDFIMSVALVIDFINAACCKKHIPSQVCTSC